MKNVVRSLALALLLAATGAVAQSAEPAPATANTVQDTANAPASDDARRTAQEAAAKQKLAAVRAEIKTLTAQQRATEGKHASAADALRDQELAIADVVKELRALDDKLDAQQGELAKLETQRGALETTLKSQREALAALLRSAYALGRNEELKLLLQQEDVAAIARVLAYHRYFQQARIDRIRKLLGDLRQLADLEQAIAQQTNALVATRSQREDEAQRLETERAARAGLLADLDVQLKDQQARLAALGKDEKGLNGLIEKLRDIFADIPKRLAGAEPFASLRGRLAWPLRGRLATAFGGADEAGRKSAGLLIAVRTGSTVRAVANGRVVFADWLRGYGLLLIIDHGDGYMSLYGCNESLLKDVGDWVKPGEAIATSGASGGQKMPGLYFELRYKGQPLDPRPWLK